MTDTQYAVGILGHFGNENLGDEAIIEACVQSARQRLGATNITLFSINPDDTAKRYQLPAYPLRYQNLHSQQGKPRGPEPQPAEPATTATTQPDQNPVATDPVSRAKAFAKAIPGTKVAVNALRSLINLPGVLVKEFGFLKQSKSILRDIDLLIVAGSNQFLDNFGGSWGFPYTILKWTCMARMSGTDVVMLSIGAGPIDKALSRFMVRCAIRLTRLHSYRDPGSRLLIEGPTAKLGGVVAPDLARNFEFETVRPVTLDAKLGVVAINPMPVYDHRYWPIPDEARYQTYLGGLAQFAVHVLKAGHTVKLFPTQKRDRATIADLYEIVSRDHPELAPRMQIDDPQTAQELMRTITAADVIVPVRYHGTILGLHSHRLVLSVCYQAKAMEAMEDARMGDFSVMLDDLNASDLCDRFDRLWQDRQIHIQTITETALAATHAINRQYKTVSER